MVDNRSLRARSEDLPTTMATYSAVARPGSADAEGDRSSDLESCSWQYEQVTKEKRVPCRGPSITKNGMWGWNVLAPCSTATHNYDIDLFRALITAIGDAHGTSPDGFCMLVSQSRHRHHLRGDDFLIADVRACPPTRVRGYCCGRSCAGPCATPASRGEGHR